jgi:4'-phosphopantetheinyl transferase
MPSVTEIAFFRFWTAKEAVLKAIGKGLIGLSDCRIHKIIDDTRLQLICNRSTWMVVQRWIRSDHLVAVTADQVDICWHEPVSIPK